MYRAIGAGRLASGEALEFGVVTAPDPAWAGRLGGFLLHKGGDWSYHIRQALTAPLDDLQTRFYVALVGAEVVSQVMIVSARQAGILGHVYTAPRWRRQGAYGQLMAAQMDDIRRLGVTILTLGTAYDGHPYHIYFGFGFRPVAPGSGFMRWLADPEAEARYLRTGPATVRPLRWGDWADLNLLAAQPVGADEPLPRLPTLGLKGQQSAEGPFLTFIRRATSLPDGANCVLQSKTGAVVGWRFLAPDPRWFGDAWLLDVGVASGFEASRDAVLAELAWPDAPVYAMTTASAPQGAWPAALGFAPAVALPRWLRIGATRADLTLWVR